MLSLVATLITIGVSVVYIVDVVTGGYGVPALIVALPYILANLATVVMLTASLFSKPLKSDRSWWIFFVSLVASNVFAVLHFSGVQLVNPNLNASVSLVAQLASLALVPFYVVAVVTLGKDLTVMPEARDLITRGPYSLSRHPLYVTYIVWFVLEIAIAQTWAVAATTALMVVLLVVRARREEQVLASAFPAEYAEYRSRVGWLGRWTPAFAADDAE